MARRRRASERKIRTRVLADLSANHTEKQALLCAFAAERVRLDYGIDLIVQTFNRRGEVEGSRILFQLKGTDRIKVLAGGSAVSCRIERADLAHWLAEPLLVVLVLYDAKADVGYWLLVRRYFAELAGFDLARCGERVSVSIPRGNVLDRNAMRYLAREKNRLRGEAERLAFNVIQ
ncbi:MAG TPA: DUF4365 domain-containing protein [Gemmataceae bacterium]|nr:DUF4365 domain-containing protein [Gemmataceae bacterium]